MALLTLIPSSPLYSEGSQVISTVNKVIQEINSNVGLGGVAQGAFVANGSIGVTMTSLGPTGSHTTIQKWLSIVDDTGATVYIPAF